MSTFRLAWRSLTREPGFTTTALLTLALGIGVSTAMFSFVDAVLLKPVSGIADDDRLTIVGGGTLDDTASAGPFNPATSAPVFFEWRARNTVFSHVGASTVYPGDLLLTGGDRAQALKSLGASAGFFETLGIQPLLGRTFRLDEERAGTERVVMLTHRVWQSRFGADARVLGTAIRLNGQPHTIVGILPANPFLDTSIADLWVPLAMEPDEIDPRNFFLVVHGRLRPGVTASQAETDLNPIHAALKEDGRAVDKASVVRVRPYRDRVVGRDMRRATWLLSGAVAFVLLIACINLAHLLVARYARTRKDVAVRVALGARRSQLTRQFLAESLLLCLTGGAAGVLVASWLVRALLTLMPSTMTVHDVEVVLDARVLLFAGGLSILTGVIFGLLPTLTFARADLRASGLNVWASSSAGGSRPFARQALLVGEVALTLTLVSGSMLLLGSLGHLLAIDPGFRTARTVALHVRLDQERYGSVPSVMAYQDAMLERIRALPGVSAAAASNMLPLTRRNSSSGVWLAAVPASRTGAGQRFVSPDYFSTMGMNVVRGRGLTASDGIGAPRVVVINERYARVVARYRDPIGAELQFQGGLVTVVGVVNDVKHRDLTSEALNEIFAPLAQAPAKSSLLSQLAFVARTTERPAPLARALSQLATTADPNVAVVSVRTMDEFLTESIAQPRFLSALFGLFGALALGLTAVGLYGVLSSFVSERTRELAIRLALGAQRQDVMRLVMRQGLAVTLIGVTLGFAGAIALGRALTSLLFEVSPTDPTMYAGASALLAAVASIACWLPARRATTADPLVVLRAER